jgi:hypothetical protein
MFPKQIIDFFSHPIFAIVGGFTVIIAVFNLFYRIIFTIIGVSPIIIRIGKGIWRRKIGIIGNVEAFSTLSSCIIESGIFKKNNVVHIPIETLDKSKSYSVLLVDWESSKEHIDNILINRKNHNTAIIVFAKSGTIPQDMMPTIANNSNTVVVNFKGRLINDLLNSLITTSFDEQ